MVLFCLSHSVKLVNEQLHFVLNQRIICSLKFTIELVTQRFGAVLDSLIILFSKIWKKVMLLTNDLKPNKWEKQWKKKPNKKELIKKINEFWRPFSGKKLNFYQGDMILDSELEELIRGQQKRTKRNAVRQKKRLWTSRTIPYVVPGYMST